MKIDVDLTPSVLESYVAMAAAKAALKQLPSSTPRNEAAHRVIMAVWLAGRDYGRHQDAKALWAFVERCRAE